jgi:trk system potassium uptake protein TrkA
MSKRIIILGAGRFGTHLAGRLSEYGCEVAIADHDADRVKELAEDGFHSFEADVEDEEALKELGVREADAVVVSIGENMQGSVLATMALKELKVKKIIARAGDAKHGQVLEKVGADLVVLPTRDMAYRLADRLRDDAGSERQHLSGEYQIAHIRSGPALHGKTLAELGLREKYRVNVVLVTRPGPKKTTQQLEAQADLTMALNDICIIAGLRENINRFERECGLPE